jgi:DNA-binding GntR family transcriptional regulator
MLLAGIQSASSHPGRKFMSNRAIARRYKISYQTADLLVRELAGEGLLDRRPASGTYITGAERRLSSVFGD